MRKTIPKMAATSFLADFKHKCRHALFHRANYNSAVVHIFSARQSGMEGPGTLQTTLGKHNTNPNHFFIFTANAFIFYIP